MNNCKRIGGACLALALLMSAMPNAFAAATAEEAKALGGRLTPFGADAGANADGSIPAYDGGLKSQTKPDKNNYADPYASEKPLYSITAQNMGTYEGQLGEGTKALLKQFPTFRVDVYPTHRTMQYPQWFLDNTVKNATTAKLEGQSEGDKVGGAGPDGYPLQGIPFPIPKNGYEVMWNSMLRFAPAVTLIHNRSWLVDASGSHNELPGIEAAYMHPWSEQSGSLRKDGYNAVFGFYTRLYSPATSAGITFLNYYLPDAAAPVPIWIYTPGQRRVRKAPEFAYDIPMSSYAGVLLWDEAWGFVGRMDRFDFKLIGKKEMIVPYNVFGVTNQKTSEEVLDPKHVRPDAMRWEKRRVWVVEADRKPDARHAYSKRNFYIEEDCWCMVGTESYDNAGKLWRVANIYNFPAYDVGGMNNDTWSFNDLLKGNYILINTARKEPGNWVRSYPNADGLNINFTPQAVSAGSVR